jgi:hypothetical protein
MICSQTHQEILQDLTNILKNEEPTKEKKQNNKVNTNAIMNERDIIVEEDQTYEGSILKTNINNQNRNIKCKYIFLNKVPDISTVEHVEEDFNTKRQKNINEKIFNNPSNPEFDLNYGSNENSIANLNSDDKKAQKNEVTNLSEIH